MKETYYKPSGSTGWKAERRFADEVPAGKINGRNVIFRLKRCPTELLVSSNWRFLVPGRDYVVKNSRISFKFAPSVGEKIVATYIW